jgi:hypothetical protein
MPRLDAPGTLHHVIVRGIEKRRIVDDRTDREALVCRMGDAARDYIAKACEDAGVQLAHLRSGAREAAVSRCRSKVARHLVEEMGLPPPLQLRRDKSASASAMA